MANLNSRQARILLALLKNTEPISIRKLSLYLDLPARVIRHNLPFIEKWLTEKDTRFSIIHHNGLLIDISDVDRKTIKEKINQKIEIINIYSAQDRVNFILFELLLTLDYYQGPKMQLDLSVARSTITRDLKRVEDWLVNRNLALSRETYNGFKVIGSIVDERHALIALIAEQDLEAELLNFCIWGKATSGSDLNRLSEGNLQMIMKIHTWKIQDAWRIVNRIIQDLKITLSESVILYLVLYWAIMRIQCQSEHIISSHPEKFDLVKDRREFIVVQSAAERLYKISGLRLPEQEIVQFTMELMGSSRAGKFNTNKHNLEERDQLITIITNELISRVGKKIDENLENPQIQKKLYEHISRQLFRLELNLPLRNKLSKEIQYTYPNIWQATIDSIDEINKEIGIRYGIHIPGEEASYLTMYMALAMEMKGESSKGKRVIVVCPSGGITVWMVVSRLKNEFPEITIVDVVPLKKLSQIDKSDLDAIITTINIIDSQLPVFKISPIVTKEDIELIQSKLIDG